jgi:hypothetical protein
VTAGVERRAQGRFLLVEWRQALLAGGDLLLDGAHARRDVDELAVELAPVVADLIELAPQVGFPLARLLLLAADDLELLVALLKGVELGRALGCRRDGSRRRGSRCLRGSGSAGVRKIDVGNLAGRPRRRLLRRGRDDPRRHHREQCRERCCDLGAGCGTKPVHQSGNHQCGSGKNRTVPAVNRHDWYGNKTKPGANEKRG